MLESAERRKVRLIMREIIFEEFQHVHHHNPPTSQTDRRTDGQLTVSYATLRAVISASFSPFTGRI